MNGTDLGRFYGSYQENMIPSQPVLFEALETIGYETKAKRILSTKSVGVPITVMLLLMHDALQKVEIIQKEMMAIREQVGHKTTEQVVKDTGLQLIDSLDTEMKNTPWRHERTVVEYSPSISGSTQTIEASRYTPDRELSKPLSDYISSVDVDCRVAGQSIIMPEKQATPRPNIGHLRPLFSFIEFTYAVSERIQTETKLFNRLHGENLIREKVKLTQRGRSFELMRARRTALTHEGNINVQIDPADSSIKLSGKLIDQEMEKALDEVVSWVEETYAAMILVLAG